VLGASGIFMRKQALCLFYGKQNLFFNFSFLFFILLFNLGFVKFLLLNKKGREENVDLGSGFRPPFSALRLFFLIFFFFFLGSILRLVCPVFYTVGFLIVPFTKTKLFLSFFMLRVLL
jgi:hypothetical protein